MSKTSQREMSYFDLGRTDAKAGKVRKHSKTWRFRNHYRAGIQHHKILKAKKEADQ